MVVSKCCFFAAVFVACWAGSASAEQAAARNVVPCAANGADATTPFRFPAMAQKTRRQGSVQLRVLVDDEGNAQTVSVSASSGSPELDRAARIGARNAALCLRDGKTQAEPGYAQMQVNFKVSPLLVGR
jgi:TonB family protein